jgi:hypothetical protein
LASVASWQAVLSYRPSFISAIQASIFSWCSVSGSSLIWLSLSCREWLSFLLGHEFIAVWLIVQRYNFFCPIIRFTQSNPTNSKTKLSCIYGRNHCWWIQ